MFKGKTVMTEYNLVSRIQKHKTQCKNSNAWRPMTLLNPVFLKFPFSTAYSLLIA